MRSIFAVLMLLLMSASMAWGQDPTPPAEPPLGWETDLTGTLGVNQAEFENYVQGGESSLTWALSSTYDALRTGASRDWKTRLELEYGQTRTGESGLTKSTDRIELNSGMVWKTSGFFQPTILLNAKTQFAKGFEYDDDGNRLEEVSRFANPLYLNETIGASHLIATGFRSGLGVGFHEVFVTLGGDKGDRLAATYTDDPETPEIEKTRVDIGVESITSYDREFPEEKVKVFTELKLFSPFDDPAEIDVSWKTKFTAEILSFIGVTLMTDLIYDEDILNRTQFKETLTLGFTHKFF